MKYYIYIFKEFTILENLPKNSIFFSGRPLLGDGREGHAEEVGDGRDKENWGERRGTVARRGESRGVKRCGESKGVVGGRGESTDAKTFVG